MKIAVLIIVGILVFFLFTSCSPLGKKVDKDLSKNHYFSKKKKGIYYCPSGNWFELGARPIKNADRKTFQVLNSEYSKDANQAYYQEVALPKERMDLKTFQAMAGEGGSYLAKDKNHVFRMDYDSQLVIIEGADPNTFEVINYYFQKDEDQLFYNNKTTIADPATFKLLNDRFARDKDQSFFITSEELKVIPETVGHLRGKGKFYAYDDESLYFYSTVFQDKGKDELVINPLSGATRLELLEENYIQADDKIYVIGKEIKTADPASFETLKGFYSKDKDQVYYFEKVIDGADPSSFRYDEEKWVYRDHQYSYERGERVTGN